MVVAVLLCLIAGVPELPPEPAPEDFPDAGGLPPALGALAEDVVGSLRAAEDDLTAFAKDWASDSLVVGGVAVAGAVVGGAVGGAALAAGAAGRVPDAPPDAVLTAAALGLGAGLVVGAALGGALGAGVGGFIATGPVGFATSGLGAALAVIVGTLHFGGLVFSAVGLVLIVAIGIAVLFPGPLVLGLFVAGIIATGGVAAVGITGLAVVGGAAGTGLAKAVGASIQAAARDSDDAPPPGETTAPDDVTPPSRPRPSDAAENQP